MQGMHISDLTVLKEMLAAGPGCAIANGILNGFETTKVKLQLHSSHRQHQSIPAKAPRPPVVYQNATMTGVMSQIAKEEGIVRGLLTPGLSASLTRSMLYGAYRVGLYPTVRDSVGTFMGNDKNSSNASKIQQRILSGMVTGGLGSMVSCPLDVVRTRMQADAGMILTKAPSCTNPAIPPSYYGTGLRQGQAVRYTGMWSALVTIWREEGLVQGLYRGASVTIARACVLNGAQLASYDTMKHYTINWGQAHADSSGSGKLYQEGPLLHISCALFSGILAQSVIMPIDTVKSHMMLGKGWKDVLQHIGSLLMDQHSKAIHPIRLTKWLYRGYAPACAGQGLIMVLQMPLIEAFRRSLGVAAI